MVSEYYLNYPMKNIQSLLFKHAHRFPYNPSDQCLYEQKSPICSQSGVMNGNSQYNLTPIPQSWPKRNLESESTGGSRFPHVGKIQHWTPSTDFPSYGIFLLGVRSLGSLHSEACWGCKRPTSGLLKSAQLRRIACSMWSGTERTQWRFRVVSHRSSALHSAWSRDSTKILHWL